MDFTSWATIIFIIVVTIMLWIEDVFLFREINKLRKEYESQMGILRGDTIQTVYNYLVELSKSSDERKKK